jgi:hypothetical protein
MYYTVLIAVVVRTIAPMAAKNKAGCWITKARIIGAMIKAAAFTKSIYRLIIGCCLIFKNCWLLSDDEP